MIYQLYTAEAGGFNSTDVEVGCFTWVFQFFRLGSLVASRKLWSDCAMVQREDRMQATPPMRQKVACEDSV